LEQIQVSNGASMSYLVGGILVHGDEPSNVIFGLFGKRPADGGNRSSPKT
jgi:hypothetical protein